MLLIKKYTKQLNSDWDLFVQKSFNGTLFQTQKFLSYHQEKKINDCSLMFYKNQQIVAVLPAAETKQNQIKTLYSHPGASYGGLIIDSSLSFETIDEIINQLIQYAKKQNFKKIILINSPSIYCKNKNETLHYLLLWNKFNINEIYISHATKLNKPIIGLLQIRKKRYVKQIIKNSSFSCEQSQKYDEFYKLLIISKKQHKTAPTHSLKELVHLQKTFPKQIVLLNFSENKKIIGGSLVFIANKKTGLVFYNVINQNYRNTQLAVFQLYSCMEFCYNKKLKYVDFGVSHLPKAKNPLKPKKTLIKFKEFFGARGIARTIYEKKLDYE
ncbi:MAG: hypothetical protein CMG64_00840 [Candidatus Marinimicrobia bacterium]|nr:hypothetical protein [Candidatus Neomarinimicrobiota bacterium]|tara:strand:+ start:4212 stop:5192 length:981 start_codon:yes stop_codon:yes gene_type:complete